jgi:hypothetical protein
MTYQPITLDIPRLADGAIVLANAKLVALLPWLGNAFGSAQKIPGEKGFFPNIPIQANGTKDYLEVFPNEKLGNFSFWDIADGQTVRIEGDFFRVNFQAGLVVWGDLRNVYPADWQTRTGANVEHEVSEALRRTGLLASNSEITIFREADNIYRGYNHKEVNHQFLLRPYFGFRINCSLNHKTPCSA